MKIRPCKQTADCERGYVLLVFTLFAVLLVVAMYNILPKYVFEGQREKEEELIFRGEQYERAIQLFVRKNGRYPMSLDDLQDTNNIRYIRKLYPDPMTKDGKWRLIHVLPGPVFYDALNPPAQPANAAGTPVNNQNNPFRTGLGNTSGSTVETGQNSATSSPTGDAGATATNDAGSGGGSDNGTDNGTTSGNSSGNNGSQPSSNSQTVGSGGAIAGVASKNETEGIKVVNGYHHYNEWEFIFNYLNDPLAAQAMTHGASVQQITPQQSQQQNSTTP